MTIPEGKHRKAVHLAAQVAGRDNADIGSLGQLAQTAERGRFDFVFLTADFDVTAASDVRGRPDTLTTLAALAGVTERIGLVGTLNVTVTEPFEVARQFATLDHLSDGRAGWNVVTRSDGFAGANFRRSERGGPQTDQYRGTGEFLDVVRQFWDSWDADAVIADEATGIYVDPSRVHTVSHMGAQFQVRGMATLPAGPQGHPVLLQDGDSAEGRDFGAAQADVLFTAHSTLEAGQRYYADAHARAVAYGRAPARPKVLQIATPEQFVGAPDQVADEIDRYVQADACDGFILAASYPPNGLDQFVEQVVPLLQQRGVVRTEYSGETLREHLGLTE